MSLNAPNPFQYSRGLPTRSVPHAFRSAPTQNARPVPVTTTTRISSFHDASSHARAISRSIRKSNAFSTSGRFSRIVARWPSFVYTIRSNARSSGASGSGASGSDIVDVREVNRERAIELHRVLTHRSELGRRGCRLERVAVRE